MRKVRFRAWYKEGGYMMPVEEIDFNQRLINKTGIWRWFHEVDLMQYTGLKDKNGVEVYEGDIVRYFRNELAVIVYRDGGVDIRSLSWKECEPLQRRLGEIEVIGDIYQNKDLLEG